jgi:hypothetical protein
MNRHLESCLYLIVAASLLPGVGVGQATNPTTTSDQSTVVQHKKKAPPEQTDVAAQPKLAKPPAPSAAQQFVKHGARDPSTACTSARTDKNGQLDCGMHGRAAKPNPR